MALATADFASIFNKAYGITNTTSTTASQLKCFTCGKLARQSSTYVICSSGVTAHRLLLLDYVIATADMHEGFMRACENTPTLIDKSIT